VKFACLGRCYVEGGIKEDEPGRAYSEDERNFEGIQNFFLKSWRK
jgi:hypothetical protein